MQKNKPFFKLVLSFVPAVIWAGVIYYLSAQQVLPSFSLDIGDFLFKKSAHMFVYAILYLLILLPIQYHQLSRGYKRLLIPLFIAITYAILDEFHLSLTPGRTPSLRDVGFDTLGCSIVILKKLGYI